MHVAHAEFTAQLALLDGPAAPEAEIDVRIGKLILDVDDGADVIAFDGVGEALGGHLAAAVDTAGIDNAQPFVGVVDAAEVHNRSDDDHDDQRGHHGPSDYPCHVSRSVGAASRAAPAGS